MKLTNIIELIINENIAYRMALNNDIVNYSSMAKKIKNKVDKLSGRDVPLNTIVKLLTIYGKRNKKIIDTGQALKYVSFFLDYGYIKKTVNYDDLNKINFLIAVKNGQKYDILYKDENAKEFEYAMLNLRMKESFTEIPGITVLVVSILEMFEIKINNIYRIGNEIFILLNSKDAPKALEKLAFYSSIQNNE
ncbi:MAG: hypothetical protein QXN11_01880 [Thermoplasmata archaeon]